MDPDPGEGAGELKNGGPGVRIADWPLPETGGFGFVGGADVVVWECAGTGGALIDEKKEQVKQTY